MADVIVETVFSRDDEKFSKDKKWKLFLKQLLVISAVWTSYFMYGLCLGSPTVFIPQIRKSNSNDTISDEMASWLSSIHIFSGLPAIILLSFLAQLIGRKKTYLIVCLATLTGFFVFYFSISVTEILISEIVQGFLFACQISVSIIITAEYSSPVYRGLFLSIKVASFFWGIWIANAIGTFFNWRKIGILGILCSIYTLISVIFWPESPYWLASKKRFNECAASHRWLKGSGEEAEEELKGMIESERYLLKKKRLRNNKRYTVTELFDIICSREFFKPVLLSMLMLALYNLSGKVVCSIYVIDILKKITQSESTAYVGMLSLDGVTVLSMYIGGLISKFVNRRTLLFTSTSIAIVFLFTISFYLYLINVEVIVENKYFSILLLSLFSISISCGPMNMCTSIFGELISLEYRSSTLAIIGVFGHTMMAVLVKIAPLIFKTFKLHGAFLFYGLSTSICTILLYKYLPETKDKTLQQIQDSLKSYQKEEKEATELM